MVVKAEKNYNDPTVPSEYRNSTLYYHYNHRGDTVSVSDGNGTHIWQSDYDAFGQPLPVKSASGAFAPRYTFSTKRYFPELGTYYYGHRWYLPELCRWMQKDPGSYNDGFNYYVFCSSSPVTIIDEYGLSDLDCTRMWGYKPADGEDNKNDKDHTPTWFEIAMGFLGNTNYARSSYYSFKYPANEFECGLFMRDLTRATGLPEASVPSRFLLYNRPAGASEWASDMRIEGWSSPYTGDPHGYGTIGSSGAHMGMYVAPKTTISASSVDEKVVTNDWGFRSGRNEPVVHWRDPLR